jgi:pyruvate/2-oxoglutarate dehydrogenase complex dihydrolipoamide dehydrogenase (E3) component
MTTEKYKNIIIGSGEGGKYLAWHLAQSGQQTVVIERRWIGGSCPNVNCLPSKNEIWSAKVAHLVQHAGRFGATVGTASTDMAAVRKRKREMIEGLIAMHLDRYKATGTELVMGEARFIASNTLEVRLNDGGTRTLAGERIFLNLGTHASIPSVPGLAESEPLTNIEALELDRLPEHLIVIGGGYVGLEFAQAYRRFGSRVTILQQAPQLLAHEDPDVAAELLQIFGSERICVIAPAEIVSVHGRSGERVEIRVRMSYGEKTIAGSDILIATGRTPNTAGIGLEVAGVDLDQRGYVKVNDRLETTALNIWAIGESAGSPQFTHISLDDFRVIRDNLAGGDRTTHDRIVPSCLFTDPQLAHVGLTETEAKHRRIAVRVAKVPMSAVLRTRTIDETCGFMKALIEANGDRILGFTMIGPEAGEVMAVVQMAMLAGLPYTALRDAVLAHPTMAEGLNALFSRVEQPGVGTVSLRETPATLRQDGASAARVPPASNHRA